MKNLCYYQSICSRQTATKFCPCHDSSAVVTCAKFLLRSTHQNSNESKAKFTSNLNSETNSFLVCLWSDFLHTVAVCEPCVKQLRAAGNHVWFQTAPRPWHMHMISEIWWGQFHLKSNTSTRGNIGYRHVCYGWEGTDLDISHFGGNLWTSAINQYKIGKWSMHGSNAIINQVDDSFPLLTYIRAYFC